MSESKHSTWLWPDRTIGKRESRALRDEHNRLINSHAKLLEAIEQSLTAYGALGYMRPKEYAQRRFDEINRVLSAAIEKEA